MGWACLGCFSGLELGCGWAGCYSGVGLGVLGLGVLGLAESSKALKQSKKQRINTLVPGENSVSLGAELGGRGSSHGTQTLGRSADSHRGHTSAISSAHKQQSIAQDGATATHYLR